MANPNPTVGNPRVVIIGAGFGGLSAASSYAAFQHGIRLITGLSGSRMEDMPTPVPMDPPEPNQARQAAGRSLS
jgi:thioredoxin reductase